MDIEYHDAELGPITIRRNVRARRYMVKITDGKVFGTIPNGGNKSILLKFIEEKRDSIKTALARPLKPKFIIDENAKSIANLFQLKIYREERNNFRLKINENLLSIACPLSADFADENTQSSLKTLIENALKTKAASPLQERTAHLAKLHNFTYSSLTITKTKSKWGSCSKKGDIRLTYSLLLLPEHLRDYVIVHELCHTVQFNHSPEFWRLVNNILDGKAASLRNELKAYSTKDLQIKN